MPSLSPSAPPPAFITYFCSCLEKLTEIPWKPADVLSARNNLGNDTLIRKLWYSLMAVVVRAESSRANTKAWTMSIPYLHQRPVKSGPIPHSLKAACHAHLHRHWPKQAVSLQHLLKEEAGRGASPRGLLMVVCWLIAAHGTLEHLRKEKWQHHYQSLQRMKDGTSSSPASAVACKKAGQGRVMQSNGSIASQQNGHPFRSSSCRTVSTSAASSTTLASAALTDGILQAYGQLRRSLHTEQAILSQRQAMAQRVSTAQGQTNGDGEEISKLRLTADEFCLVKEDALWTDVKKVMEGAIEGMREIEASIKHDKVFWRWLNKSLVSQEGHCPEDGGAALQQHDAAGQVSCLDFPLPPTLKRGSTAHQRQSFSKAMREGKHASASSAAEMEDLRHYHAELLGKLEEVAIAFLVCSDLGRNDKIPSMIFFSIALSLYHYCKLMIAKLNHSCPWTPRQEWLRFQAITLRIAMVAAAAAQPARIQDHLVAGTIAGLTSTGLLFPLDLIKTHYQVYDRVGKPYTSVVQGLKTVVSEEGYRGLYKGLSPALLANGVSWGGYFLFYEHAKNRYLQDRRQLTPMHHLLSAFEAGIIMVFLTNPLWLIKTRMQLQPSGFRLNVINPNIAPSIGGPQAYTGLWHAFQTIVREEGPLGLYKGIFPAILLTSHGAIQFVTYEWLKKVSEPYDLHPVSYSALGGTAKIVAGLATYPYQVIKTRLQQRETGTARWKYVGTWDTMVKIWRYEGVLGYFKGCVPNVLKTAPSAAITFVVYEEVIRWLNIYREKVGGVRGKSPPPLLANEKTSRK